MMEMIIRLGTPDDAQSVIDILNPIILDGRYTVLDAPFTVEEEKAFIQNFPKRGIFHVAERPTDRKIVGFQSLEPFASYTHAFDHVAIVGTYVDSKQRRQGIASQLFAATFEAAVAKGYEKIFTYVRGDNPTAFKTYLKQGFKIVGTAERQAKINGRYIDEIIIEKLL
ncbi:MAG: GNAT family N-acetyltransferase [Candidatus Promineifilaceae bacterium]